MATWCSLFHTPIKAKRVSLYSFMKLVFDNDFKLIDTHDLLRLMREVMDLMYQHDLVYHTPSKIGLVESKYAEEKVIVYAIDVMAECVKLDKAVNRAEENIKVGKERQPRISKYYTEWELIAESRLRMKNLMHKIGPLFVSIQLRYCPTCKSLLDPRDRLLKFMPALARSFRTLEQNEESGMFSI